MLTKKEIDYLELAMLHYPSVILYNSLPLDHPDRPALHTAMQIQRKYEDAIVAKLRAAQVS